MSTRRHPPDYLRLVKRSESDAVNLQRAIQAVRRSELNETTAAGRVLPSFTALHSISEAVVEQMVDILDMSQIQDALLHQLQVGSKYEYDLGTEAYRPEANDAPQDESPKMPPDPNPHDWYGALNDTRREARDHTDNVTEAIRSEAREDRREILEGIRSSQAETRSDIEASEQRLGSRIDRLEERVIGSEVTIAGMLGGIKVLGWAIAALLAGIGIIVGYAQFVANGS